MRVLLEHVLMGEAKRRRENPMPPVITLTITLDEKRQLNVAGPIDDKILSFGMLECAKDAIRDHIARNQSQIAVVPPSNGPPFLNKQ
jgi:hypothetical protein